MIKPFLLGLALVSLVASQAFAGEHWFIYRADPKRCSAVVDVSAIGQTTAVVELAEDNAFASFDVSGTSLFGSVDLAALTKLKAGQSRLVRVATLSPIPSFVTLRTTHGIVSVPEIDRVANTGFVFPIGNLGTGATLLIGNPNGIDVHMNVAATGELAQQATVLAGGVTEVPLAIGNTAYTITSGQGGPPIKVIAAIVYEGRACGSDMALLSH